MSKLERIERDIARAQEKAREWQAKAKELDGLLTEQENIEIVSAVRALKMTRAEIRAFVATGRLPDALSDAAAIPAARFERKPAEAAKAEGGKPSGSESRQGAAGGAKPAPASPAAAPATGNINSNKESEGKRDEA